MSKVLEKFDENGLPRNPSDWTEQDWRDLHQAMTEVQRLIGKRHAGECETQIVDLCCPHCRGSGKKILKGEYAKTWEKIKNRAGEFTGAMLGKEWGVPATRINNQLAALEKHGLLRSSRTGRTRLYRVSGN